jgi:N-acetylglutamate synthase-like GNAT family acetyltransferase
MRYNKRMRVRKARKDDFSQILKLARALGLDYADMAADDFWVAEDKEKILGICGLKKHPDCFELCSLGVDERYRRQGLAGRLVMTLLQNIEGEIYLATIIPGFFEKFGFKKTGHFPSSMVKTSKWCAGCNPELCTVMIKANR